MKYRRCVNGGYQRRSGGATDNCCSCGCSSQSDCTAVGGEVLGAKYNGGDVVLRVGGTGVEGSSFPRFPYYKVGVGIIPSIHYYSRCAMLWMYPDAVHDGTKYTVNPRCMTVVATGWRPNGSPNYPTGRHSRDVCDAYNPNAQRGGWDFSTNFHDAIYNGASPPGTGGIPSEPGPSTRGLQSTFFPLQIGTTGTMLYGGPLRYSPSVTPYWYVPTDAELTLFASKTSGLVSAGVKHTLILYVRAWRSPYKTLAWDGVSWPSWWTSDGLTPAGAADMEAYRAAGSGYSMTPEGQRFFNFTHQAHAGWRLIDGVTDVSGGKRQIMREPYFAGAYGAATDPSTTADSRIHLIGVHAICTRCDNEITGFSGTGTFVPKIAPDQGDGTTTCGNITCSTDIDLNVTPGFSGCTLLKPIAGSGSSWLTIGTPFKSSTVSPGCWDTSYIVPLHFTGTGATTLTFGGRTYNLTKT